MLNKLDLYIVRQFSVILAISILGFLSIFLIVDVIENLDRFMDNKVPSMVIFQYYIYTLPYFIGIGLPMSVLLSTVFSLGSMVKKNEWTAMKSSGISLLRVAIPFIICGLILSYLSFILDNRLVTYGNEKRFEIDRDYVKRKSRHKLKSTLKDIFLQKNSSNHISLSKYFINKDIGYDLTMLDLGPEKIRDRIDAKKIVWKSDHSKWELSDFSIRVFDDSGLETEVKIGKGDTLVDLGFLPNEIQQQARKPDELNYYKLTDRIRQLKQNGVDTIKWEVTRQMKVSFAFTNLVVLLCGIPLVVMKGKNSLSFGAGASVFVIFGYYVLIKFGQSLGFKGVITPILSAWMGNIVFLLLAFTLFYKARN